KRFYKYFPWLFIFGDLLVIIFSLFISENLVSQFVDFNQSNRLFYLTVLGVWLLVTTIRKDYKLGRTSEYLSTLKKLLGSVFWFLSLFSLVWFLFQFQYYHLDRFFLAVSVASMLVFVAFYRVSVHMTVKQYRIKGGNYSN